MADADYTTIFCTALKPRDHSIWLVLPGPRSVNVPLSCVHRDDLTAIIATDRVHDRNIRIRTDMAKLKGLDQTRNPDAACADLFGGK